MVLMQLAVPAGVGPGDQMTVSASGQEWVVTVPETVGPGEQIEVDLPVQEHEELQLTIPEGCQAGDLMSVQAAWGGVFEVRVGYQLVRIPPICRCHKCCV